jgi:hypothetical protein
VLFEREVDLLISNIFSIFVSDGIGLMLLLCAGMCWVLLLNIIIIIIITPFFVFFFFFLFSLLCFFFLFD